MPAQAPFRADSVFNHLTGFGGYGDKGGVGRPSPYVIPLTDPELRNLYSFNGISRRIVDLLPSRATRRGWTAPDLDAENRRLQIWSRVGEAMTWARLYGGAGLLLVTQDDLPPAFRRKPDQWLAEPLDLKRVGKLLAIQVLDVYDATPMEWETDLRSPRYRLPRLWSVSVDGFSGWVHGSRIVHFRGARRAPSERTSSWRSNRMPDDSALQVVWDEIRRLTETMQGGAVLAAEIRESVLKVADLGSRQTGDEGAALAERLSLMSRSKSLLGMTIIGEGDDYQNRGNPPTGWSELSDGAKSMLSAVTGIPEVILYGSTPGGLNTDGDSAWEGFRQQVSDYQETNRQELEQLCTVMYASQDGPTRGRIPAEWDLVFHPLDEPGEKQKAEVRKAVAEIDAIYLAQGVYSPEEVARARFGPEGWAFDMPEVVPPDPDEEEAIEMARQLALTTAEPEPKEDAADGTCCILVPAVDPGLRALVEKALGQPLQAPEDAAHVTVLYLGAVAPESLQEAEEAVDEAVERMEVGRIEGGQVVAFPPGDDGVPIVVEFTRAWPLEALNADLLRGLAHLVTARQHRRFRPHLTIGYARGPLPPEAHAALAQVDVSDLRVPVTEVWVMHGGKKVAALTVGSS